MSFDRDELVIVHGRAFVVLATIPTDPPETLLIDAGSGHPVLSMRPGEAIRLPSANALAVLASASAGDADAEGNDAATERMRVELDLLDAAGVRNGSKAIWLWLNAHWRDDLRRRFGEFDDPATIKRWRTQLRRLRNAKA